MLALAVARAVKVLLATLMLVEIKGSKEMLMMPKSLARYNVREKAFSWWGVILVMASSFSHNTTETTSSFSTISHRRLGDLGNVDTLLLHVHNRCQHGLGVSTSYGWKTKIRKASASRLVNHDMDIQCVVSRNIESEGQRKSFSSLRCKDGVGRPSWLRHTNLSPDNDVFEVRIPFPREVTNEKGAKSSFNENDGGKFGAPVTDLDDGVSFILGRKNYEAVADEKDIKTELSDPIETKDKCADMSNSPCESQEKNCHSGTLPNSLSYTQVEDSVDKKDPTLCIQCDDSEARKKIIVIGAGPAGLTAARHLQRQVDLFESNCPLYDIVMGQKVPGELDEALEAEYNSLLDEMQLVVAKKGDHALKMSLEEGLEYGLKIRRAGQPARSSVENEGRKEEILSPLKRRVMDWHLAHWNMVVLLHYKKYLFLIGIKMTFMEDFTGDAALIKVPLGFLKAKTIKFSPSLPEWKYSSIQRLGFSVLNKVVLEFLKYVAVGASGENFDTLGRPVDNCLFFSGDATCKEHPDTVGGAMITGMREAVRTVGILTTRNNFTSKVEAIAAAKRHSDSERSEVRDIIRRLDTIELTHVHKNSLLRNFFNNAKSRAGRLHLAKELLDLPSDFLKSFAGTK
ncbi:homeodomain-like protein [Artemisia annua]|uniref:Homeodomain-like protein n=1 Tax=Artemisia annua TaxID=35608 RepID=A0A2U1MSQ0_ARTAN|nr:homeodomain-like protein [Artemisia annua]